jgi:hypothetical protein
LRLPWIDGLSPIPIVICIVTGCSAPTATRTGTGQPGGALLTAVYSRASDAYHRTTNSDGSFKPETYVFKEGGNYGGPRVDPTMDKLTFADISRVIAAPLAAQDYEPSDDPSATQLMIVVFWGVTLVPNDLVPFSARESSALRQKASGVVATTGKGTIFRPSSLADAEMFSYMEADTDGRIDAVSSNILGYTDEVLRTPLGSKKIFSLRDEIEQDRYYVVLLAYDYPLGRKTGLQRLLWETRFSIPEPGNDFEKAFPMMASLSGKYFGQNTHGLIHHNLDEPRVEMGEPKSLGTVPEK